MASLIWNNTGRWSKRVARAAELASFVVQLVLCCGATNAVAQPTITNYADLPELPGPFSELKDVPPSLKGASILRTSGGDVVILPTTLRLYPDEAGYRLEHNVLSAVGLAPGPLAQLELFVQPTVTASDFGSRTLAVSKAYPQAKVGRPKTTRMITAEFIIGSIFGERHKEPIVKLGPDFSVGYIAFVTFEPTQLFMRLPFNSDADVAALRVTYDIPFENAVRQFQVGMSFSFNCHTSPRTFLDLTNATYGCPDCESWKLPPPLDVEGRLDRLCL